MSTTMRPTLQTVPESLPADHVTTPAAAPAATPAVSAPSQPRHPRPIFKVSVILSSWFTLSQSAQSIASFYRKNCDGFANLLVQCNPDYGSPFIDGLVRIMDQVEKQNVINFSMSLHLCSVNER